MVVKALRSSLVPREGMRASGGPKAQRSQRVEVGDVEDAEFEDIEEKP